MTSTIQDWVHELPMMQQAVMLAAIRGPDGVAKYHPCKPLIRWYRRCILVSAFDGRALDNPCDPGGGSFTGPSADDSRSCWEDTMTTHVDAFLHARDEYNMHYFLHMLHAIQILGYKHPSSTIRGWWHGVYLRTVSAMHLMPESEQMMDARLGDNEAGWLERTDASEVAGYKQNR